MNLSREPLNAMESLAETKAWRRGQEIYGREDPAEHWYRVVAGAVRKCVVMPDGRRQIVEFLLPGDFFGFAAAGDEHRFDVEAVVEGTIVARYPRRSVEMLADTDPQVGRLIRQTSFEMISRLEVRMLILGRMSALEKVGAFLLEMAERMSNGSGDRGSIVLPMSRYDIADYLALAVETVSRALTEFKARGVIRFESTHRVRIVDHDAFENGNRYGWIYGDSQRSTDLEHRTFM